MARLLALSALVLAASSAARPVVAGTGGHPPASSPTAGLADSAADDDLRCRSLAPAPMHAAPPPAAHIAPPGAVHIDGVLPRAGAAAGLPPLALAPKTSPPPARRHRT